MVSIILSKARGLSQVLTVHFNLSLPGILITFQVGPRALKPEFSKEVRNGEEVGLRMLWRTHC